MAHGSALPLHIGINKVNPLQFVICRPAGDMLAGKCEWKTDLKDFHKSHMVLQWL